MNLFKLFADLEAVDGDAAEKIAYYSRRQMISGATSKLAKMTTGAAVATFGTVMNQAFGQAASATEVLNLALTLEYLESDYYARALAAANLIPAADRAIFTQIAKHEDAHVALLRGALMTAAAPKPNFRYPAADTFTNYQTFLGLAQALEDTGVRAYKGQAGNLLGTPTLTIALQIHSVEARHASQVRRLRGLKGWVSAANETPAPVYAGETGMRQANVDLRSIIPTSISDLAIQEAFDEPLDRAAVLAIATPYIG
ncbi:MAG: ferritin-like domain-containing protein [Bacteroidetes bacterium]|nr:ferritin-like domain-containing protein [Fibrella sp.]